MHGMESLGNTESMKTQGSDAAQRLNWVPGVIATL